jgi:uncharacterized Zn-binding protein involved in type VI secretion
MAAAARLGDPGVTDCSPFNIQSGSGDVFVNGRGAARLGDGATPHKAKQRPKCPIHVTKITGASGTVFVNGRGFARVGDPFGPQCTQVQSGSGDVFVGG